MSDGNTLSELTLLDNQGRPVKLADLWQANPLLLVFLRWLG